ncbi:proton channel OtopLc-like isoform X2 [Aricia agestis]|uniref:proton channel OtopLc-like isoform X2 n=1 Tax=Aricia agestis TaxID=91739 RepID=UPI001C20AF34|nr:proton channel OtopLc-like isoform X2 [Aricia agestis]
MNEVREDIAKQEVKNENDFQEEYVDRLSPKFNDDDSYKYSLPPPPPDSSQLDSMASHPETPSIVLSAFSDPSPTTPKNKSEFISESLTSTLSNIYALFIITLGVIIYTGDFFYSVHISPIFSCVLIVIGLVYLVFLIAHINIIKYRYNKLNSKKEEDIEIVNNPNGNATHPNDNETNLLGKVAPLEESYQFTHGRHSGSFYLKLGATGFAIGHLIHGVLLLASQIQFYMDDKLDNDRCLNIMGIVHDMFNPLFCFLELYFIFNYSNIVILKYARLANLGFTHLIASSICFWISTIYRETHLSLTIYANSIYGNKSHRYSSTKVDKSIGLIDLESLYDATCVSSPAAIMIFENFSPYLFPFGVEFNILIVAFYYVIWSHIGRPIEEEQTPHHTDHQSVHSIEQDAENESPGNIVVHVDCHGSSKGLFFGLVFVVLMAANVILGFVLGNLGGDFTGYGYALKNHTKLWMHFFMTVAVIIAYKQSRSLDVNDHPISKLDDVFLYICLPAFFMETLLSLLATIVILNIVRCIDLVLMVIQVIIQTIFLIDGMRRCSNTKKLRRYKPGRDAVMFLLIANVCMWLFNTFSFKSPESVDERYEFYGKVLWTILGHVTLPLMMFYRFHSSVCLADIWYSVYKPSTYH